jgi:hypothetical protein
MCRRKILSEAECALDGGRMQFCTACGGRPVSQATIQLLSDVEAKLTPAMDGVDFFDSSFLGSSYRLYKRVITQKPTRGNFRELVAARFSNVYWDTHCWVRLKGWRRESRSKHN